MKALSWLQERSFSVFVIYFEFVWLGFIAIVIVTLSVSLIG